MSTSQGRREGRGDRRPRSDQSDSNFIESVVKIYRVAKVVKGGRRFSFSAIVVVGDGKGRVGAAMGKAREVPDAIRKAIERAKRNMVGCRSSAPPSPTKSWAAPDAARVLLKPASLGTGIVAGGPVRAVVEAAGYQNILTKSLGSNNATNVVWATMDGLQQLQDRRGNRRHARLGSRRGICSVSAGLPRPEPSTVYWVRNVYDGTAAN